MTQSLAQKRAKHALGKIKMLEAGNADDYGNYLAFVKSLPAKIIMAGLGQAMAMEKAGASKKKGHDILYAHMNEWLCAKWPQADNKPEPTDILEAITTGDQETYIRAQAEAIEYLEWLKKFAVAFLVEKDEPEGSP